VIGREAAMGSIFRPKYKMKLKDGTVVERQVEHWHIQYQDANGRTRKLVAGPSKALARELLAKVENDVARERRGLPTQNIAKIRVAELRDRYLEVQKTRVCQDHHQGLTTRLDAVIGGIRAGYVRDLTPEAVERFLIRFGSGESSPSARTINTYLQAVKGMLNWAVEMRILPFSALTCLKPRRTDVQSKKRRALSAEELKRLFEAARQGPILRMERCMKKSNLPGKTYKETAYLGERNALIYRLLAYTGLRVHKELGRLRWADVDLGASAVRLPPEITKNKRGGTIQLPNTLVRILRRWKARHEPVSETDPVVRVPGPLLATFHQDLELAGIDRKDASGRSLDLHALRHTYCTMLIQAGNDVTTVQHLMRHSTPILTLGVYSHLRPAASGGSGAEAARGGRGCRRGGHCATSRDRIKGSGPLLEEPRVPRKGGRRMWRCRLYRQELLVTAPFSSDRDIGRRRRRMSGRKERSRGIRRSTLLLVAMGILVIAMVQEAKPPAIMVLLGIAVIFLTLALLTRSCCPNCDRTLGRLPGRFCRYCGARLK
jgi:integrase